MSEPPDALPPGMRTITNAVENASVVPITPAGIVSVLKGEGGPSSHLRAIFGDVSIRVLEEVGAGAGIGLQTILDAYRSARDNAAASSDEIESLLADPW